MLMPGVIRATADLASSENSICGVGVWPAWILEVINKAVVALF